jgi:hypothetical protein
VYFQVSGAPLTASVLTVSMWFPAQVNFRERPAVLVWEFDT